MKTTFIGHSHQGREYFTNCPHALKWLTQMGMIVRFEPEIKEKKLKQA